MGEDSLSGNNRNLAIDMMKGIGIVLMVIGHFGTLWPICNEVLTKVIYSFHMPMFFFISGFFFKTRGFRKQIVSDSRRLLIPYAITMTVVLLIKMIRTDSFLNCFLLNLFSPFLAYPFGLCVKDIHIQPILVLWFLIALFIASTTYNIVRIKVKKKCYIAIACFILGLWGVALHRITPNIPFCISQGLSAVPMLFLGNMIRTKSLETKSGRPIAVLILILLWLISIPFCKIGMVSCEYRCYPFDIVTSLAGTCVIFLSCKCISKFKKISSFLSYIGRNSIWILCVHAIDMVTGVSWYMFDGYPLTRMAVTIIFALMVHQLWIVMRKRVMAHFA